VALLQQRKVPFVTHGRTQFNAPHAWVDTDNEQAFFLAAERLIGLGHHRIGLINGHPNMTFAALRETGFRRALEAHGLDATLCPVRHGEVSAASGEQIATELIANYAMDTRANRQITAMICATDAIALGAMASIRQAGLAVGRDISVIGYGNTEAGLYADPPLTTIDHAIVDNGRHLAELLMRRINDEPVQGLTRLEPVHLISRLSDGPAPAA
jgi:LacI family transcriptional regulator